MLLELLRKHYKIVVWPSDMQPGRKYFVVRSRGYTGDVIKPETVLELISQDDALNHFKMGSEVATISDFDLDDLTLLELED